LTLKVVKRWLPVGRHFAAAIDTTAFCRLFTTRSTVLHSFTLVVRSRLLSLDAQNALQRSDRGTTASALIPFVLAVSSTPAQHIDLSNSSRGLYDRSPLPQFRDQVSDPATAPSLIQHRNYRPADQIVIVRGLDSYNRDMTLHAVDVTACDPAGASNFINVRRAPSSPLDP
jgi:hypothetical protein